MTFEEIYKTYWQKVLRICLGYVQHLPVAQDLTQDIFIKIWRSLPEFRGEASLDTWIYRITANTCIRQLEKNQNGATQELPIHLIETNEINLKDEVKFLYQCIAELPELERIIISLELEDVPQKEIALIVGISNANVRVKVHRIKEKLTQKFKRYER